jgi:hypothetical protein
MEQRNVSFADLDLELAKNSEGQVRVDLDLTQKWKSSPKENEGRVVKKNTMASQV